MDLVELAKPLQPLTFPDGSVQPIRVFDAVMWRLFREVKQTGDDAKSLELMRMMAPEATDENLESLGTEDVGVITLYAQRKIRLAEDGLKNSSGRGAESATSASSPPTTSSTLSPESPEPMVATGGV